MKAVVEISVYACCLVTYTGGLHSALFFVDRMRYREWSETSTATQRRDNMDWVFELIAGPYGGTTEGPAWDGQALLFTHIPGNRIMRYEPHTGACTEFRTGTHSTNGLMFDAQGRLYGCQAGQNCITRFEPDGRVTP